MANNLVTSVGSVPTLGIGIDLAKALIIVDRAKSVDIPDVLEEFRKVGLSSSLARKTIDLEFPTIFSIHGRDIWTQIELAVRTGSIKDIGDATVVAAVYNKVIEKIASNSKFELITENKLNNWITEYTTWSDKVNQKINQDGSLSSADAQTYASEFKTLKTKWTDKYYLLYLQQGTFNFEDFKNQLENFPSEDTKKLLANAASEQDKAKAIAAVNRESQEISRKIAGTIGSLKIATTSFANFRDNVLNPLIKNTWAEYNKPDTSTGLPIRSEIQSTLPESKVTSIFNWGHTSFQTSTEDKRNRIILSPKSIAQIILASVTGGYRDGSALAKRKDLEIINYDFQVKTGQVKTIIKTTTSVTDRSAVLEIAFQSGIFQAVLFQEEKYNTKTLGQQERKYNIIEQLKTDLKLGGKINPDVVKNIIIGVINQTASLSFNQKILSLIAHTLAGKKPGSSVIGTKTKTAASTRKVAAVVPKLKPNLKGGNNPQSFKLPRATAKTNIKIVPLPPSAVNLENLLNAKLTQTIKQNMGSGNRRDILNLRSGRFAESVRVERISESRQGMVTAFYTYMRNPYATFSEGGRQQNPRSRDPKLLISKSIRQLAQQITQQRLRAVLV